MGECAILMWVIDEASPEEGCFFSNYPDENPLRRDVQKLLDSLEPGDRFDPDDLPPDLKDDFLDEFLGQGFDVGTDGTVERRDDCPACHGLGADPACPRCNNACFGYDRGNGWEPFRE